MFSIAAINDTDSRGQWEPLAPTKEAQEFHLSQTYHDGLVKLQAKEYEKAQELLEAVLKDPLMSNAQLDNSGSDGHFLQLRFLTLKNLASVFLEQGSSHYESALGCYLQAVEIDTKDSVVWNQLGTLSCSMGLLSISRWAFEQGLICSPNNWNCMEKLLEVLIAIGDEVACLSVAELILRHWPSHSRAFHVKRTIEDAEPVPFAPRGIDKLEPHHVRLRFLDKRKARDENVDEGLSAKKLNQIIELHLGETTWVALTDALLGILHRASGSGTNNSSRSGDIRLSIDLLTRLENAKGSCNEIGEDVSPTRCLSEKTSVGREKLSGLSDDQPHERRSSRLERLRSRKPGKEESDFTSGEDLAKVVVRFLEPFIVGGCRAKDAGHAGSSASCLTADCNPSNAENDVVLSFLKKTTGNCGAYHLGHLLLEEVATIKLFYQDAFVKFLELEKLTRHWGRDRTPECSLFLAELYYDLGVSSSDISKLSECMLEVSYHLCKIIESVAMDHPFGLRFPTENGSHALLKNSEGGRTSSITSVDKDLLLKDPFLANQSSFWLRFYWLSGQLSICNGDKEKAHDEFLISLSLLAKREMDNFSSVHLPHCKVITELTVARILHEINLLKVDFLLQKTVGEMIEKELYLECINMLAPLILSANDVHLDALPIALKEDGGATSLELSALDVLIKACEKVKPTDMEMILDCHRRKLQILSAAAGMDSTLASYKHPDRSLEPKMFSDSEIESKENSSKHWSHLVAEEVKAISQIASCVKNLADHSSDTNELVVPISCLGDMQSSLLAVMQNIASIFFCQKSSGLAAADLTEQKQILCFVDSVITFCLLQHLTPNLPVKAQVELLVAIHELLAEYGLCCAGDYSKGEEGAFLKFAIKHLLVLDMKLKTSFHASNHEKGQVDNIISHNNQIVESVDEAIVNLSNEPQSIEMDEGSSFQKDSNRGSGSPVIKSVQPPLKDLIGTECEKHGLGEPEEKCDANENKNDGLVECGEMLSEEEKEELEEAIGNALDQCFFCLYGLNLRSDSGYEEDLVVHKNTSRGEYQTKEQCADVFHYVLSYAKGSSKTGLIKLRRVLRAIRKHFPKPPEDVLTENKIDKFLDDPNLCEDKLSNEAGSSGFLETMMKIISSDSGSMQQSRAPSTDSSEPYLEVYCNLYYLASQAEEISASDKWPGFVLTKEGEEFVEQNENLFKYDLLYNPQRLDSWQRLANIYDEEVDLLLNDGSKHINVIGWRKDAALSQRVETSRRRSRRCFLMCLALAKTPLQQSEIHESLALVYYDGLQNVVPFYDQRSVGPLKDASWRTFCQNSLRHFKKASELKQDWSHAFYMGKLSEKLGYSREISFSYYDKAITLNPSAVDPVYRMHASRLKLLSVCGKQNLETLKVVAEYSFNQATKDNVMNIFGKMGSRRPHLAIDINEDASQANLEEEESQDLHQLEEVWCMLYRDCLSALEICVEGDLKHFHKARYMLAQGLYRRGENGDIEKAKDELSFCFKSSRSSFTINMWEIDGMVKKGRRKTSLSGNRKVLEVNLPESSRKFITCIRKYILFYLKLLEETGDISTLDRAYISLRADKRFSMCLEDLVPVALGRYVKALISSIHKNENPHPGSSSRYEHLLEKMFSLFMEQVTLWSDISNLPEMRSPEWSESNLYSYLYQYIMLLETNIKLETLESINEKIRKRFKNPKLSNNICAKVCRHTSAALCRSLIVSLALITRQHLQVPDEAQGLHSSHDDSENNQLLYVYLKTDELWASSFEEASHMKNLETKWIEKLSMMRKVRIKKVLEENMESVGNLLRYAYHFYRDSSSVTLPSGVILYMVPTRLAQDPQFNLCMEGVEILELNIQRKLLLWAYTLATGQCTNISGVIKHCEENIKSKVKKGSGTSTTSQTTSITAHTGGGDNGGGVATDVGPSASTGASLSEGENTMTQNATQCPGEKCMSPAPLLQQCNSNSNSGKEKDSADVHGGTSNNG